AKSPCRAEYTWSSRAASPPIGQPRSSGVGEPRRALLEVGHHRLELVRRAEEIALQARLQGEALFEAQAPGLVEEALGGAHGVRGSARDLARQIEGGLERRIGDAGGEAERDCFGAADDSA